jgi:hypothetical protein
VLIGWSLFFSLCLLINMLCRNWKGDLDDGNGKIYHELMIQTKFRMREMMVKACESSLWDCVSVSKNKNL